MKKLIQELKRRRVFRVATIYAVAAWPMVQLADLVFPALELPDRAMTYLLVSFIAGFPIALILSWLFNLTSKGIVLAGSPDGAEIGTDGSNKHHDWVIVGSLLIVALLFFAFFSSKVPMEPEPANQSLAALSQTSNQKAIAVLPFKTFSADPNDQYFADGLSEELAGALSTISDLRVAANTSSFAYRDSAKPVTEIGKELNVGVVLEGTVRRNNIDNRIRVSASLVDVETGSQVWSQSFDREFKNLFKVQEEISNAVTEQLKLKITGEQVASNRSMPTSVDALIAHSAGNADLQKRTVPALKSAIIWFQKAIELDPGYGSAYVGLANSASLTFFYGGMSREEAKEISLPAIEKALQLNPNLGSAYAAKGLVLLNDAESSGAEVFIEAGINLAKSIELSPNYSPAYIWYGNVLANQGKKQESIKHYRKALLLDSRSVVAAHNIAENLFSEGREREALELVDQIIEIDPFYPGAFNLIGNIYLRQGRLVDAYVQYKKSLKLAPLDTQASSGIFKIALELKDQTLIDDALNILVEIDKNSGGGKFAGQLMLFKARSNILQGNKTHALEQLEQALEMTQGSFLYDIILAEKSYFLRDYGTSIEAYENVIKARKAIGNNFFDASENIMAFKYAFALQQTGDENKANQVLEKIDAASSKTLLKAHPFPGDYFVQALSAMIKNNQDQALLYLRLAVNAGWTSTWLLELDPVWESLLEDERLLSLVNMVDIKLANMRRRLALNADLGASSHRVLLSL